MMLSLTMISDPWSLSVSNAVSSVAGPAGLTPIILADSDWRTALVRQNADAVFIDYAGLPGDAELLASMAEQQHLVVFSETLEPHGFDVIRSEAGSSCAAAMDHLLAEHTKIAILGTTRIREGAVRYGAHRDGLERAGLEFREDYVGVYEQDAMGAHEAATRLLQQPDRPTTIFASTDFAAIAAIHAAQRLQLRVAGLLLERATEERAEHKAWDFPWQLFVRDSAPGPAGGTEISSTKGSSKR